MPPNLLKSRFVPPADLSLARLPPPCSVCYVTDGEGVKSLALFPAKFQKSFWIKNGEWLVTTWLVCQLQYILMVGLFMPALECAGNFVVVDASGRDEALESGSKIGCVVSRVLFHEQVRALEKSGEW
jgi:probable RNA-binding protein EIF1AD